ncbi:hypothetical protein B9Z55_026354 [Caenorhabditis nigoni]|uniref:Uncharacterized protein n=1 Tax=Caenorhabditis nigoni TaxID=1611254 RepID=A0A2G5T2C9_9PELO|nr:hypothetical protein B9Z55_026354 [Caenorhabditis nigoni]
MILSAISFIQISTSITILEVKKHGALHNDPMGRLTHYRHSIPASDNNFWSPELPIETESMIIISIAESTLRNVS